MTSHQLSEGVISNILAGEAVPNPVFQILGYKKVSGLCDGNDRYRLLISDGKWCYPTAMLGIELSGLISSGNLEKYTVVKVNKYECTTLTAEKKLIILLDVEVISPGSGIGKSIGHPVAIGNPGTLTSPSPDSSSASPEKTAADSTRRITRQASGVLKVPPPSPPRVKRRRSPTARSRLKNQAAGSSKGPTTPRLTRVAKLHPYRKNWTIRARVTNKTIIREFANLRREGKLFTLDLIDESGEIRAVMFNRWVDKYFDMMQINKVYYISNGRVKVARQRYSSLKHYYELHFTAKTTVVPYEGDCDSIPTLKFNVVPLDQLQDVGTDIAIDVIGICRSSGDVETALAKGTIEMPKRDITLVDKNNTEVIVSLWGSLGENFDGSTNPVVALKGVRVTEQNTVTTMVCTVLHIDPDVKEARDLKKWFNTVGRKAESKSVSRPSNSSFLTRSWKTLAQARKETENTVFKPQYYKTKATVVTAKKENCLYMSCPSEGCSKKVNCLPNGKYECTGCRREHGSFRWRLLLAISLADFSDKQWATCLGETAESLLNKNAQQLRMLRGSSENAFSEIFSRIIFESYVFELCTKKEAFKDEKQLKTAVLAVKPVNSIDFSRKLLDDIRQMKKVL